MYADLKDWDAVKETVVGENLLQKTAIKSRKEIYREISSRLKLLTGPQLEALVEAPTSEVKLILLLGICKCYRYITDFILEVLRNKALLFDYRLTDFDYERFFETKYDIHPEMERLTERSLLNVKNMTMAILGQSGMTIGKGERTIQVPIVPQGLVEMVVNDNPNWLQIYLMSDSDIQHAVQKYKA